jgi:predicted GNAT superfamily acetyltransferase
MISFTLAIVGVRKFSPPAAKVEGAGNYTPFLHSHMTAVLSEYRNAGVGRRLKLFQRQDALDRRIPLVEWTFDPLETKNAYFNIERLGVIVRRYIPNCYGITDSPLHSGIPTDRFVPEWWLDSERVKCIVERRPLPHGKIASRIFLPRNITDIKNNDADKAIRIQSEFRTQCEQAFGAGLVVVGIELGESSVDYLLQDVAAIGGLALPGLAR